MAEIQKPIKSIFLQREVQKLYRLERKEHYRHMLGDDDVLYVGECTDDKEINIIKLGEYELDIPILEAGESFFLSDLNRKVVIKERMRDSNGSITYFVEDNLVETEETTTSLKEANEALTYCERLREQIVSLKLDFDRYKKMYPYRNRFFNF